MTNHNTDHTDCTKVRRSALVSLDILGMVIALRWLPQLDHDRSSAPKGILQGYLNPYVYPN